MSDSSLPKKTPLSQSSTSAPSTASSPIAPKPPVAPTGSPPTASSSLPPITPAVKSPPTPSPLSPPPPPSYPPPSPLTSGSSSPPPPVNPPPPPLAGSLESAPESPPIPPPPPPAGDDSDKNNQIKESIFKKIIPLVGIVGGILLLFLLITKVILPATRKSKEPEPVTLTYWGLWEQSPLLKATIDAYQTQNPHITINYQQQSHKDYRERLQSALARGDGPDIFRFHNTWVPMLKSELASVPATVFDTAAFSATYYPVMQQDLILNNQIIGIPLMIDGLSLYYNKGLFESGGKSPPQNWEELRQAAFDLTVRDESGKIQTAGVALGTTGNIEHWSDIFALMLLQNGANPASPSDTAAADALKFYTIFNLSDRVWNDSLPNSVYAFATGKVAMIFAPSWQTHTIKDINPQIEFGIVAVPKLPGTDVTWASYWVEGVSQKSQNQEEAFKFLKYLSEKTTLVGLYTEASKTRSFGEPYPRKDMADLLSTDELVGPFVDQASTAQSFYLASRTFDNGINDKIIKYYEDAVNATNQGEDPETALQTTTQGVQQVLSQYGISTSSP